MIKLITLIFTIFLTGCMYQSVNFNDIETSQKICSNNSSTVVAINADFLGMETVECSNRKIYSLSYK